MLGARIRSLIKGLRHRHQVEQEMSDEMHSHLEARTQDLIANRGLSREQAYCQARIEFGSLDKYREESRRARGLRLWDETWADLKYAYRNFRRSPAFTLAAIATLALGIGANTTVFTVVDAALLKKLPVQNPDELVAFDWIRTSKSMLAGYSGSARKDPVTNQDIYTSLSLPIFDRFQTDNQTLSDLFAFAQIGGLNLVADKQAEVASAQLVSGGYYKGLGVEALLGRTIVPDDDSEQGGSVVVISYRYWQRRFNGDPDIVGKPVEINGTPFSIVGVAPQEFFGTRAGLSPDLSIPMARKSQVINDERQTASWVMWIQVMGRMKPGVTKPQVLANLQNAFAAGVRESFDARPADRQYRSGVYLQRTEIPSLRVISGAQGPDGPNRGVAGTLRVFFGIVVVILVIICANLANLFLARASTRRHEISIRLSIGASRRRLIRQLLTETVLLAFAGGFLGAVLSYWGQGFMAWVPSTRTLILHAGIDLRVLAFAAGLSLLTGILFGVGPAFRATSADLSPLMRTSSQKGGSGTVIRKSLIVVQVALSLALFVGAGLLITTLRNLQSIDVGFNPNNLMLFGVSPQIPRTDRARIVGFYERMIEKIQSVPGVESVSVSSIRPLSGSNWTEQAAIPGSSDIGQTVYIQITRANYFTTMQMPLVAGRTLADSDIEKSPHVAVINETMAKKLFMDRDPIGSRVFFPSWSEGGTNEVVGIVRDARYAGLAGEAPPTIYLPYTQKSIVGMTFEVRTATEPASLVASIRRAVQEVDPNLPMARTTTQIEQMNETIGNQRMFAFFSGIFSVIAALLVCIGLYGIVSFGVNRRVNEIGLRMALGAQRQDVVWLILRETLVVLSVGLLLGLGASFALTRFIAAGLYGITAKDPVTTLYAVVIMSAICVAAAFLPARRASRIDPMRALRYD
jgi:predicted permease